LLENPEKGSDEFYYAKGLSGYDLIVIGMPPYFKIRVSIVSSLRIIKLKIRVIANAYLDVRRLI
jgi:hypothetical protein